MLHAPFLSLLFSADATSTIAAGGIAGIIIAAIALVVIVLGLIVARRRQTRKAGRNLHLASHLPGGASLAYVPELYVPQLPDYAHEVNRASLAFLASLKDGGAANLWQSTRYQPESQPNSDIRPVSSSLGGDDLDVDVENLHVMFAVNPTASWAANSSITRVGYDKSIAVAGVWQDLHAQRQSRKVQSNPNNQDSSLSQANATISNQTTSVLFLPQSLVEQTNKKSSGIPFENDAQIPASATKKVDSSQNNIGYEAPLQQYVPFEEEPQLEHAHVCVLFNDVQ